MNPSQNRPERIEDLFQRALEIEPGARESFLLQAAHDDSEIREAVQRLLQAYKTAESSPAWQKNALETVAAPAACMAGSTLDRYRIIERIGAGGMAVVYKAVRADDEFSKLVAVKILLAPDPISAGRFRDERQILAGLEHPNIARLLDGGTSPEGAPFLVMEYVEGKPLNRYIGENRLSTRDMLSLFRKICAAVSYAHRNLVVHRDLKPANILVTADGEPKLLDFGIARLLDGSAARTRTGFGAMTIEYASPEQVRGGAMSTATDVYSLGVILYELLCGVRPYRNADSAMQLAQSICEGDILPPRAKDGRSLNVDLRTIVQMAMRREPERRYAGADQLAEDIRRYQEGYPVLSRPDTYRYRFRKFARRNRPAIAAGLLVLGAIAGGIIATARQASIANRRFKEARQFASSYVFEVHDAIKDLPGATAARRLIITRALDYLDRVAAERGNDRDLQRELAAAYARIGDIQGRPVRNSFGDRPGARASFQRAIAILAPMVERSPGDAAVAEQLALVYEDANAVAIVQGDLAAALEYSRKGIALMTRLTAAHPRDAKLRNALASVYIGLGDVSGNPFTQNLGDTRTAIDSYSKAQAIWERLSDEAPADLDRLMLVAIATGREAQMLEAVADARGAVEAYRRVVAIDERVLQWRPADSRALSDTAVANRNLARALLVVNETAAAERPAERAMQLYQRIANADPNNFEAQTALGYGYSILGRVEAQAGRVANAFHNFERAITIYERAQAQRPAALPPVDLRATYEFVADLSLQTGDAARALRCARKELLFDDRLLAANPSNASALRSQSVANRQLGLAHEAVAMRTRQRSAKMLELQAALQCLRKSAAITAALQVKRQLPAMYAADIGKTAESIARAQRELSSVAPAVPKQL